MRVAVILFLFALTAAAFAEKVYAVVTGKDRSFAVFEDTETKAHLVLLPDGRTLSSGADAAFLSSLMADANVSGGASCSKRPVRRIVWALGDAPKYRASST
ncbi:hypothetical protein [Fimbriimonas ginsengisoli]|uniref:Uncharacterized protein n=1 Tax=Fimbriimonas ginsengisoli Gsoil 348 TaxID=661478 RepID=A0A068NWR7_FIMGI|nr:hypothetical protein [Fimbriimonas ginsengisoli]AIE86029.1 hypothetical protein OP10G_2661 [Fimbriimonas ginsengisoli Gsoil 348]